jgi:hypothetical protein
VAPFPDPPPPPPRLGHESTLARATRYLRRNETETPMKFLGSATPTSYASTTHPP